MTTMPLVELWRGEIRESVHMGSAVVCTSDGSVVEQWGDSTTPVLPRSSAKMIQALPLVESGAAASAQLGPEQLALACASHSGAARHTRRVASWLGQLGLSDADLRCGAHRPKDRIARQRMRATGAEPLQRHNNCSGKHSGFLTLSRHLGADSDPEYLEIAHPVQQAVASAWQDVTGEAPQATAIDGCSAPNHATSLRGLATAMAGFADAAAGKGGTGARPTAQAKLVAAMMAHPDLVAGPRQPCTSLIRAMEGAGAVKTGAEGVYVAILPELGFGAALKIADGTSRASRYAIAALLVRLGVLPAEHPLVHPALINHRGLTIGRVTTAFATD